MRSVAAVVASVALLGFYAWAAYLALHPRVSNAYAAYYIHRTTALTIKEQGQVAPLAVGVMHPASASVIAFAGWHAWDGTRRQSARPDPSIIFLVSRDGAEGPDVALRLVTSTAPGQPVTATLNGVSAPVVVTDGQVEVSLPRGALRVGENAVTLGLPRYGAMSLVSVGLWPDTYGRP